MELLKNPDIKVCGSFVHFKDVETLISYSDAFVAYERAIYMKTYGLGYDDAQTCALMEYDLKLEIMSNDVKISLLRERKAERMNKVRDHLGNEFPSLGYMCQHWHVQPFTFTRRRNLGWSVKDSLLGRKSISFKERHV